MPSEHVWEARLNIAETRGTASVGTLPSSSTSTIGADSCRSAENAGVTSPTETSSGERMATYQEGFEDSLELCLTEVKNSNSKKDAIERIRYLLGLVKERKFDRLREMIGTPK